jgi:hypothetical protein
MQLKKTCATLGLVNKSAALKGDRFAPGSLEFQHAG